MDRRGPTYPSGKGPYELSSSASCVLCGMCVRARCKHGSRSSLSARVILRPKASVKEDCPHGRHLRVGGWSMMFILSSEEVYDMVYDCP